VVEKVKLFTSVLPIAAAIGAFYYYADESLLIRVMGLLLAMGLSVVIALQSDAGRTAFAFVRDARTEVRKVVWPSRKETVQTTMFVMVAVIIMGIILWLLDMFLAWAVRFLTVSM
jgi:preprotein translocase subunit SecE